MSTIPSNISGKKCDVSGRKTREGPKKVVMNSNTDNNSKYNINNSSELIIDISGNDEFMKEKIIKTPKSLAIDFENAVDKSENKDVELQKNNNKINTQDNTINNDKFASNPAIVSSGTTGITIVEKNNANGIRGSTGRFISFVKSKIKRDKELEKENKIRNEFLRTIPMTTRHTSTTPKSYMPDWKRTKILIIIGQENSKFRFSIRYYNRNGDLIGPVIIPNLEFDDFDDAVKLTQRVREEYEFGKESAEQLKQVLIEPSDIISNFDDMQLNVRKTIAERNLRVLSELVEKKKKKIEPYNDNESQNNN